MAKDNDSIADLYRKIEELRLDMHEREKPEAEPKDPLKDAMLVMGMVQSIQSAFEPLKAAIERDAAKDAEVGQRLERLEHRLEQLEGALAGLEKALGQFTSVIAEFTTAMRTPKKRTGMVTLPSGPVSMTITEQ